MPDAAAPPPRITWWRSLGPGFVVAATGVGAGDLIAAGVAGVRYGVVVLWVVVLGAILKGALNEGVSRWQLATGTTLIEGWTAHLHPAVRWYFGGFLILWGFLVAAALASACGVAGHALFPQISVPVWGLVHSTVGFALVWTGRYRSFERTMQMLIAIMFAVVIVCGFLLRPEVGAILRGMVTPAVPAGSAKILLGLMGGVGGSVTLLCYGYWIRERGWQGPAAHRRTFVDIASAYGLTGLFGIALVVIAAQTTPGTLTGNGLILALADRLGALLGPAGRLAFLIGFWCAVFTSLLGVWQGVPYLFSDFLAALRRRRAPASGGIAEERTAQTHTPAYRWFLAYLSFPPLLLLLFDRPLIVVLAYTIAGAFFMPFLAGVLLYMNNRRQWVGPLRNGWIANLLLVLTLVLFTYLFVSETVEVVGPWLERVRTGV